MPMVRATLESCVDIDDLERVYVFSLSMADQRLLGVDRLGGIRHYDAEVQRRVVTERQRLGMQATEPNLVVSEDPADRRFWVRTAGFAVRFPFRPEAKPKRRGRPPAGIMPPLRRLIGREFYLLISSPFRTRETFRVTQTGVLRGETVTAWEAAGIYPTLDGDETDDVDGVPTSLTGALAGLSQMDTGQFSNPTIPPLLDAITEATGAFGLGSLDFDHWMRVVGLVLGMPDSRPFLAAGEALADAANHNVAIEEFYRLWSLTSDTQQFLDRGVARPEDYLWRSSLFAGDHHPDRPLLASVADLSNPTEFGSPGVLFPAALLANPYSFVGPADAPGVAQGPGGALSRRLPFHAVDAIVQTLHGRLIPIGADHPSRAAAVVFATVRHLEERNGHAFRRLTSRGTPMSDDGGFNFDLAGPSPSGSTIFARTVIDTALARRTQDLAGATVRGRRAFFGTGYANNLYPAIAGFLGILIHPLVELGALSSPLSVDDPRHRLLTRVLREVERPPAPGRKPDRWYGLIPRIAATQEALEIIAEQAFKPIPLLPIAPTPTLEFDTPGRCGLVLSQSQAGAMVNYRKWRFSMVVGNPGSGKTTLVREIQASTLEIAERGGPPLLFLCLAPSNVAAQRAARRLPDLHIFGSRNADEDEADDGPSPLANAGGGVGTIDSFLRTLEFDEEIAQTVYSSRVVLVLDEIYITSTEKFVALMRRLNTEAGDGPGLLRCVMMGDRNQLEPVEPGDFGTDVAAILPVTYLWEPQRQEASSDLSQLAAKMREGLLNPIARVESAARMIQAESPAIAVERLGRRDGPRAGDMYYDVRFGMLVRFDGQHWEAHGDARPVAWDDSMVQVELIDDLPTGIERSDLSRQEVFDEFRLQLDRRVREAVFGAVLQWSRTEMMLNRIPGLMPSNTPRRLISGGAEAARTAMEDFNRFSAAVLTPTRPFVVITMVRTPRGASSPTYRTHYTSSSVRVNGWFADMLLGRLPPDDPHMDAARREGIPYNHVGDPRVWYHPPSTTGRGGGEPAPVLVDYLDTLTRLGRRRAQQLFLADYRPRQLTLGPGWPYFVRTNDFRRLGIFKGQRIIYLRTIRTSSKHRHVFRVEETGEEIALDIAHATGRYLTYGWATNIHQLQGDEYPFVIVVWLDGLNPMRLASDWQRIRPDNGGPLDPLTTRSGDYSALDDPLNLRAFYTGVTRTLAAPDIQHVVDGQSLIQTGRGRCVIVAGKHAMRRYLGLEVIDRVTAGDAIAREMMLSGA